MLGFISRLAGLVPKKGDLVWWSPRQLAMVVTNVTSTGFSADSVDQMDHRDGTVSQMGLAADNSAARWSKDLKCWVVGEGPVPKGAVIRPRPVGMKMHAAGGSVR